MPQPPGGRPCHRLLLGLDIEDSTQQLDPGRGYQRGIMYGTLGEAMAEAGIAESQRDQLDRGDGVMVLIRPSDATPKTALLDTVVPALIASLTAHNAEHPTKAFRLRVVVSAGEVTYDGNGPYGEALDAAFRLLNADKAKKLLRETDAPAVLVVSQDIYQCVVRHGYEGIDADGWVRLSTRKVSGSANIGWGRPARPPARQLTGAQVKSIADYRRQVQ